jgi:RNA polymerase sigma factor (TIGR02999 family)
MALTRGGADQSCAETVTRLLNETADADGGAAAALLPLVYAELRRLAKSKMREQRPDDTLQATALVHESYLRLVQNAEKRRWENRRHFYAAAAEAMRCILIDNARRRNRVKRGGGRERVSLDLAQLTFAEPLDNVLALNEALDALANEHPEKAELVKLRYFAGLTIEETAQTLKISTATAERRWAFCRAWLYRRISGEPAR